MPQVLKVLVPRVLTVLVPRVLKVLRAAGADGVGAGVLTVRRVLTLPRVQTGLVREC